MNTAKQTLDYSVSENYKVNNAREYNLKIFREYLVQSRRPRSEGSSCQSGFGNSLFEIIYSSRSNRELEIKALIKESAGNYYL
jgi:hypothetical protein